MLMTHCGAHEMPLEEIRQLPVPAPQGPRHKPVPFDTMIDAIKTSLGHSGIEVKEEAYAVFANTRLFGLMEVELYDHHTLTDYAFMVGLRGSHDQTMSRGIAVGSRVFVCDNLAFSGEQVIKTKQTLNVEERLPGLIDQAVAQLPGMFAVQESLFEDFRRCQLPKRLADAVMADMVRNLILPANKLPALIREWDQPTHEAHTEDGHSVWRMHNAITQVLKPSHPDRMNLLTHDHRTQQMTRFLSRIVHDDIAEEAITVQVPGVAEAA